MSVVAFIRRCREVGMDWETALLAAEQFEAAPPLTPRQARNKRYYDNQQRLKASESDGSDTSKTVQTPSDAEPRARVRDISPRLDIPGEVVVGVVERERDPQTDDWPNGNAEAHAKLIVAEVASPWLDPSKSLDLVTTRGRIAAWKRDGASWEFDVLPVVAKLCANRRSRVVSWKFFDAAIAQSIADNRAALQIPEAGQVVPFQSTGPPKSYSQQANAAFEEAKRRILNE